MCFKCWTAESPTFSVIMEVSGVWLLYVFVILGILQSAFWYILVILEILVNISQLAFCVTLFLEKCHCPWKQLSFLIFKIWLKPLCSADANQNSVPTDGIKDQIPLGNPRNIVSWPEFQPEFPGDGGDRGAAVRRTIPAGQSPKASRPGPNILLAVIPHFHQATWHTL